MRLEEAKDLVESYQKENCLENENKFKEFLERIEILFPEALKLVSGIENFVFEITCNKDGFRTWNQNLQLSSLSVRKCENKDIVRFIWIGDYMSLLTNKEYQEKIVSHFKLLGWDCQILGEEIKISHPEPPPPPPVPEKKWFDFLFVWYEKIKDYFSAPKKLGPHPYRELPKCD